VKHHWGMCCLQLVLALCTLIVLVATPLYVYVRPAFVEMQYRRPSFPLSERFAPAERIRLSRTLVEYLRHRASYEDMATLRTDAGDLAMLPSELSHMADVHRVMDAFFWAQALALVLLIGGGVVLVWRKRLSVLARGVRHGVVATVGLMALILISATVDFDQFFTVFHSLFFKSGTWVFYYEDTLIQLYPLPLWITAVTALAVTILGEAALLWGLAHLAERRLARDA